jgi:hypothetical protein
LSFLGAPEHPLAPVEADADRRAQPSTPKTAEHTDADSAALTIPAVVPTSQSGLKTLCPALGTVHVSMLIELLVVLVSIAGGTLAIVRWLPQTWTSLKPAAIATVWGIGLFLATYFWGFQEGECSNVGSVACRINENQGVLTVLTLILAVLAVWATLLTRELDQRMRRRQMQDELRAAVGESFRECTHNLIHVAQAFSEDKVLRKLPQTSRLAIARLLQPDMASQLPRSYRLSIDAVYRTWESLRTLSWDDSYAHKVPAELRNYTRACLMTLKDSVEHFPEACGDPKNERYARDFWRLKGKHTHYYFYASGGLREVAHLRADEVPVLCWWADTEIEGVEIIEEGRRFKDLYSQGR